MRAVGFTSAAEWRIEVEIIPPVHALSVTRALFLHYMISQILQPVGVCLPGVAFASLFQRHIQIDHFAAYNAFGKIALQNVMK